MGTRSRSGQAKSRINGPVFFIAFRLIDADPTNGIFLDTSHITLGWGRDFLDVSPLRGVLIGGGQQTMDVAVTVLPAHEALGFGFAAVGG